MNLLVSFYSNSSLSIFLPLKDPIYAVLKSQNNIFNHCQPKRKENTTTYVSSKNNLTRSMTIGCLNVLSSRM